MWFIGISLPFIDSDHGCGMSPSSVTCMSAKCNIHREKRAKRWRNRAVFVPLNVRPIRARTKIAKIVNRAIVAESLLSHIISMFFYWFCFCLFCRMLWAASTNTVATFLLSLGSVCECFATAWFLLQWIDGTQCMDDGDDLYFSLNSWVRLFHVSFFYKLQLQSSLWHYYRFIFSTFDLSVVVCFRFGSLYFSLGQWHGQTADIRDSGTHNIVRECFPIYLRTYNVEVVARCDSRWIWRNCRQFINLNRASIWLILVRSFLLWWLSICHLIKVRCPIPSAISPIADSVQ